MCVHIYSMYIVCCACVCLYMWDVYLCLIVAHVHLCVYGQALSQHDCVPQVALACGTISRVGSLLK